MNRAWRKPRASPVARPTPVDDIDLTLEREERLREAALHARRAPAAPQRRDIHCVSCGEEIPAARRAVSDSCLCVTCLDQMERGMGR